MPSSLTTRADATIRAPWWCLAAVAAVELADRPVTGREFIDAVVIGYDVARRPLEACGAYEPHNGAGFHSTGTCGTFGAAAAAARILGLSVRETQNALGLASSFSSGLWCACTTARRASACMRAMQPGAA